MPKPVDGIDYHMRTIILFDPSKIIFFDSKFSQKYQLVKKYGAFKTRVLLHLNKIGFLKSYLENINSAKYFICGSQEALNILSGFGRGTIKLIAYTEEKEAKKVLDYNYMLKDYIIHEYKIVPDEKTSLSDLFSDVRFEYPRANVVALASDIKTVQIAKDESLTPVIISNDAKTISTARPYKPIITESLLSFARTISENMRN